MQFQADILNSSIEKAANLETTAMGLHFCWFSSWFLARYRRIGAYFLSWQRFEPEMPEEEREDLYAVGNKQLKQQRFSNIDHIKCVNEEIIMTFSLEDVNK
ncbi:hypothetical protein [Latilactobacillus curvatus]|uniref:hypothetical protein n=1 Tax=Latilactobacillus curvatus TaxID=28038 RepID=UPI003AF15C83